MRTRYQVDARIVHFEVDDGSESIIIELSRANARSNPGLIIRDRRGRAVATGSRVEFVESKKWSAWSW